MKQKQLIKTFLQIFVLSCCILGIMQSYSYFISDEKSQSITQETSEYSEEFSSAYISNSAIVSVALSTRVGMSFNESGYTGGNNSNFYKSISFLGVSDEQRKAIRKNMISENMILVREYYNLSANNIVELLKSSSDRRSTLESFISQLSLRFNNANLSIASLETQKAELVNYLDEISSKIEETKSLMEENFSNNLVDPTLTNVDTYFELRDEYTQSFTDVVFINQFLAQYQFLNTYNTNILDTLINNKEAIINQTYVVIPDSGSELLRPLELLFDEADAPENN